MPSKPPRPRTERYEPGIETRPLESSRNVKFDTKRSTPRTPHQPDAIGGTGTRQMTCISGQANTRQHSVPIWEIVGYHGIKWPSINCVQILPRHGVEADQRH